MANGETVGVKSKPANTFIGKGITVQAHTLLGSESVLVDGVFVGDVDLEGYLQVGQSGRIEGNAQISYALIAGTVKGDIVCRATLHLASSAVILGNITSNLVIVDEGAAIYGYCKTRGAEPDGPSEGSK
jgi:cytoskeletal protein CcmA (bactofilin family)